MHYIRRFKGGGADHDPRQKLWAVFYCSLCGHEEEVDITGRVATFRFDQIRRCPKCKSFGKHDREQALKVEIEKLTASRDSISIQIEKLTEELQKITDDQIAL